MFITSTPDHEKVKPSVEAAVIANPAETKKAESGESDPGYESDSNLKSGAKKAAAVEGAG